MTDKTGRKILAATFATPEVGARAAAVLTAGLPGKPGNIAVLVIQPDGTAEVTETRDWGTGRGALVGGAVGLLIGPLGMLTLGGLGALAAKLHDSGFDDGQLERLGARLSPNTSAVVADIAAQSADTAQGLLASFAATQLVLTDVDANVARLFQDPVTSPTA